MQASKHACGKVLCLASRDIRSRKEDHVRIVKGSNVQYDKSAGFECIEFVHDSMPNFDFAKIDTSLYLFNKKISAPLLIDSMTGGYEGAEKINRTLAAAASHHNIPFSFGSLRAMIKNPKMARTYNFRFLAPDIPIIGNIGIANLPTTPVGQIEEAVKQLDLDALYVHFNPLQEAVMLEGDRNFEGVEDALARLCDKLDVPVIAKETGAGISDAVAKRFASLGVSMVNVSGAGGTSWSKVEYARKGFVPGFEEWGIPTALSIAMCSRVLPTIASGGIRSGMDVAKSIALGAVPAGSAAPFLKTGNPSKVLDEWKLQLKTVMFLTNSPDLKRLSRARLAITGRLSEQFFGLGLDHFYYSRR